MTMLRKQILTEQTSQTSTPSPQPGEKDIVALASVVVTSEAVDHPIDYAFDSHRGPGGSRWLAGGAGDQTLIVAFDTPQTVRTITLEVEEREVSRVQELVLAISTDGGQTHREIVRQEYNFNPSGSTFEREEWTVSADGVTHVRLWIRPDKGGGASRASLTSLVIH
jgi:hypothetical protein